MRLFQFVLLFAALLAAGCSTPTVTSQPATVGGRPDAIYIYDFALDLSKVAIDAPPAELVVFKKKMRDSAMRQLLEALNRAGIASYPFGRDLTPPVGNYWLVDVTFTNIDENLTALRDFLGNGRGTHLSEAYVQISSLATRTPARVLLFETAGQTYRPRLPDAIDEEAGRIAGIVANRIVNYYRQKGWLVELPADAKGPAKPSATGALLR